jgi:V/A-type H+-transporting ATPase subunit G/H
METEQSVLQQIRRKEVELSVKVDEARREAEQIIVDAKREAAEIVKNAEVEGIKAADEYYKKRQANILNEIENLKKLGEEEANSAKMKGEQNLSKAVDTIIKVVTLE